MKHTHSMTRQESKFVSYYGIRYARGLCGRRVGTHMLRCSDGAVTCTPCKRMLAAGKKRNLPLAVMRNPVTGARMTVEEFTNRAKRPVGKR